MRGKLKKWKNLKNPTVGRWNITKKKKKSWKMKTSASDEK